MIESDKVWMLTHPERGFYYAAPATNSLEAWENAAREAKRGGEPMFGWERDMRKSGWRAKHVVLSYP